MIEVARKIWDLDELADKLRWDRQVESSEPWPVIVQAHGVFDVLHVGHVRHLQQAKEMGDLLVVTVTCDKYVRKGENRPLFPDELRAEVVAALACVDYVAINRTETAVEAIELIQPNVYVKGPECIRRKTPALLVEMGVAKVKGGGTRFTEGEIWSSSEVIRKLGM